MGLFGLGQAPREIDPDAVADAVVYARDRQAERRNWFWTRSSRERREEAAQIDETIHSVFEADAERARLARWAQERD